MAPGFSSPNVASANAAHDLGASIYDTVLALKPTVVVEFGVLNGYSTLAIAQALRDQQSGHLWSYDLWEDFPFNHGNFDEVTRVIEDAGLSDVVTLGKMDFWKWIEQPSAFDLLSLDIANDGATIRAVAGRLEDQIANGASILFEGGTDERDRAWWMEKFCREPIAPLRERLGFRVIDDRFPSWSLMPGDRIASPSPRTAPAR